MGTNWVDVSVPIRPGIAEWPGDTPYTFEAVDRIADGASCNVSRIDMSTHCGTHCDAPWHFEDGGARLDEVDPAVFFGEARFIDLPDVERITAADLGGDPLPSRVVFKTRNSARPLYDAFETDFVAVDPDAAQRIVDEGVSLVGIDGPSIAPFGDSGPTHHILLQNDVFIVEGLRLASIPAGVYPFVVLPLPLAEADGAPCRAFVGLEDNDG